MPGRRLLMITYHFPPSAAVGGHRLLGFSRHLPAQGWSCSVVAPPGLPWEPSDPQLLHRVPAETRIRHVPFPTGRLWKPLRKLAVYSSWLPWAWGACCREIREGEPDAILTSGPPHVVHLLGLGLQRRFGVKWLADLRDPWITGDPANKQVDVRMWEPRAEASVLRRADAIIVNTPRARSWLAERYPREAGKIAAIPNGFDPEAFEDNPVPACSGPSIEILHPGQVYITRDPSPLFQAMRAMAATGSDDVRPHVRFIGCEAERAALVERLAREADVSESVSVIGHVPYAEALRAMSRADVLLLLDNPGRLAGVPAKLYEYLGARRPVLALAEPGGDVEWVLSQSGLPYRVAPPRDAEAVRRALAELIDAARAMPPAAGPAAVSPFTRRELAGQLARLLNERVPLRPSATEVEARVEAEICR